MHYIRKLWFRIVFSLFLGAMFAELANMKFGNIAPETSSLLMVITGLLTFFLLSALAWFDKYKYYFFPHWDEQAKEEDILDDMD